MPCAPLRALARVGAVVAGVAAGAADRRVVHRVGDEARRRVGVAVAALHGTGRNVRRRRQPGRGGAVVAARAIGVARLVDVGAAGPAGEARGRAGVAGDAVAAAGRDVTGIGGGALRTLGALGRVRAVVAGVAAARAHRRVVHRVGGEARRRVGVAVAALDAGIGMCGGVVIAGRRRAVVAARAIGVGRRVDVSCRPPSW